METEAIITVDVSQIDEAIEKVSRLKDLLVEVASLAESLSGRISSI